MSWKRRLPREYSTPHLKALRILQDHHVLFLSEYNLFFNLEHPEEGWVRADILLVDTYTRVECDDAFFHSIHTDEQRDLLLWRARHIPTIRLDNAQLMNKGGEAYLLNTLRGAGIPIQ